MADKTKTIYTKEFKNTGRPNKIKELVIQLKLGHSPNKIIKHIKGKYKISITMMSVYRWRNRYSEITGDIIPRWFDLNLTKEQKAANSTKDVRITRSNVKRKALD